MALRKTICALVSLLALGICASTASAAPLSMTFTEARANVGKQLFDDALFMAPDTAPFAAQIDPMTGAISNGTLGLPDFETFMKSPIEAEVTVDFDIKPVTGSFDLSTGALSLNWVGTGTLTATNASLAGEQCTVLAEPSPLTLTTTGSSGGTTNPRSGVPFAAGLSGSGAVAAEWKTMSARPVKEGDPENESFCNNVEGQIDGPGGVWFEQKDLTPPGAPQLVSTDPASPSLSGTPRIRGTAEAGSTVRLYAGSGCSGSPIATAPAAELGSPGLGVNVAEGATATFTAAATDPAGNTSACSGSISYTRLHLDTCVVPNLVGKKLGRAKAALRAAHCGVGKVRKPKHRKGKRLGPLVVKSSSPSAGTNRAAGSPVDVRLVHKHRRTHRS